LKNNGCYKGEFLWIEDAMNARISLPIIKKYAVKAADFFDLASLKIKAGNH